jgi:uncharacterized protein
MSTRVEANVRIGPHDAALATDIYRPDHGGPATVIVARTMYGKHRHLREGMAWAARGYAYVIQDVRGRYESGGDWEPYRNERADGADLVDWLRTRPWAGDLVLLGGSYNAYTAWAAAVSRPDVVTGVVSLAPAMGFDAVKFDRCGVLRLDEHVHWWVDHADGRVDRAGLAAAMATTDPSVVAHLPVTDIGSRLWVDAPTWRAVIDHGPRPGPEAVDDEEIRALEVHSLHVCGWYDVLAPEAIRLWRLLSGREADRYGHTLVVGPWDHDLTLGGPGPDEQVFPSEPFDLGGTIVTWLQGLATAPPPVEVRVLPIGSTRWVQGTTWPPGPAGGHRVARWHAGPDSTLLADPGPPGGIEIVDDPDRPVPSVVAGWDRRPVEVRPDIARFTSAPLAEPLTICGVPSVVLEATSTATASDWIVRLVVVRAGGSIAELAAGTHVARRRRLAGVEVELSPCCAVVAAGDRLRVEIAGTDFPRLARNLGTGDRYRSSDVLSSTRTVLTGGEAATSVSVPLLVGVDS